MTRRSPRHDLDNWLDSHGYRHANEQKQQTPHPYAVSPRMDHASRKKSQARIDAASGRQLLKDLATLSIRARHEGDSATVDLTTRASKGDAGAWIELRPALKTLAALRTSKTPDHAIRKISSKDPAVMTAGEINKELDKLEEQNSKLGQLMIDAGRGFERPSEYLSMNDPLSLELKQNYERRNRLRAEIERRYGPGAPRRLPPGRFFGPLKNEHAAKAKSVTIVVAWTEDTQELAPGQKSWERPKLVNVKKPHAAVWKNSGTTVDVDKAHEYLRKENQITGRVLVYPVTDKDPLGRARKDVLAGRGVGVTSIPTRTGR